MKEFDNDEVESDLELNDSDIEIDEDEFMGDVE